MKGFDEDDGLGEGHGETFGECLVVESLTASLVNRQSMFGFVVDDVLNS